MTSLTNVTRIVKQTLRRTTNEILEVKIYMWNYFFPLVTGEENPEHSGGGGESGDDEDDMREEDDEMEEEYEDDEKVEKYEEEDHEEYQEVFFGDK